MPILTTKEYLALRPGDLVLNRADCRVYACVSGSSPNRAVLFRLRSGGEVTILEPTQLERWIPEPDESPRCPEVSMGARCRREAGHEHGPRETRPHLFDGRDRAKTQPPPAGGDVDIAYLRQLAKSMRADASRQLARANDLEKVADKLEGKRDDTE